jgi:hypothetical protein
MLATLISVSTFSPRIERERIRVVGTGPKRLNSKGDRLVCLEKAQNISSIES